MWVLLAALFLTLIAEVVESSAIDDGVETFLYLEQCVPFMKAKFSFEAPSAPTKLALLRICNMMLRRLSRAQHVLLAGRIHIFLSQILPSTDRSAVNANGNINDSHALEPEDVPEVSQICSIPWLLAPRSGRPEIDLARHTVSGQLYMNLTLDETFRSRTHAP